jgi:hypothetical protein
MQVPKRVWNSAQRHIRILVRQIGALARQALRVPGSRYGCDCSPGNHRRNWVRKLCDNLLSKRNTATGETQNCTGNSKRELESWADYSSAFVLSDNQRFSGTSRRIRGSESSTQTETSTTRESESSTNATRSRAEIIEMPTKTLAPNHFIAPEYNLSKEGSVTIFVEADIPVKSYIVRPKALEAYRTGIKNFKYYGGFPDPRMHQNQTIWLPFSGEWYLIISNPNNETEAEVNYEVSY